MRLLLRHRAMILSYVTSIVRDPYLAEDVFQEVGIIVLEKGHVVEDAEGFPRWVRRVARLESLNAARKKKLRTLDAEVLDGLDGCWDERPDEDDQVEALEALRRCLGKLSPKARRIVEARYGEGKGGQELAAQLGKPVNTIYVSLSRIHKTLRECVRGKLQAQGIHR